MDEMSIYKPHAYPKKENHKQFNFYTNFIGKKKKAGGYGWNFMFPQSVGLMRIWTKPLLNLSESLLLECAGRRTHTGDMMGDQ